MDAPLEQFSDKLAYYIHLPMSQKERHRMYTSLNQCVCCHKHKTDRPDEYLPYKERPCHGSQLGWDYQGCTCPCRHLMRMLCRRHPYVPTNEEEQTYVPANEEEQPSKKQRTD